MTGASWLPAGGRLRPPWLPAKGHQSSTRDEQQDDAQGHHTVHCCKGHHRSKVVVQCTDKDGSKASSQATCRCQQSHHGTLYGRQRPSQPVPVYQRASYLRKGAQNLGVDAVAQQGGNRIAYRHQQQCQEVLEEVYPRHMGAPCLGRIPTAHRLQLSGIGNHHRWYNRRVVRRQCIYRGYRGGTRSRDSVSE